MNNAQPVGLQPNFPAPNTNLKDDASQIVGYDVDKYVFGTDSFNGQQQQGKALNVPSSTPVQKEKFNIGKAALGAITLGGVLTVGISALQAARGKTSVIEKIIKIFKK